MTCIEVDPKRWPAILQHCSFNYMKAHSSSSVPLGGDFLDGGATPVINQGSDGPWCEVRQ